MSLLALIYMAITPLVSKRYSAKGRYYAWLVFVVGLIIPFRPQWGNGLVMVDIPSGTTTPPVSIGNETTFYIPDIVVNVFVPVEITALPHIVASISWWQIGFAVWLVGVITFLVFQIIKHYRFTKMAKRWNENVTDERVISLFQNLKDEMGIPKKIILHQNSDMGSPIMYGFLNPRIILPTTKLAEDELRFILKHELVHYRRKDLYYKFLVLIATAIHWFNPLVYLIARAIRLSCELSCDDEVVRDTDADTRLQYSETIIGVAKYHTKLKIALSTNFYGGKKGMKNRISSIMDTRKKKMGTFVFCVILFSIITVGGLFVVQLQSDGSPILQSSVDFGTEPELSFGYGEAGIFERLEETSMPRLSDHEHSTVIPMLYEYESEASRFSQIGTSNTSDLWMTWSVQNFSPPQLSDFNWNLGDFWEAWSLYLEQYDLIISSGGMEGVHFQMANGEDVQPSLVTHHEVERTVGGSDTRVWFNSGGGIMIGGSFANIITRHGSSQFAVTGETITIAHPILVYRGQVYIPLKHFRNVLASDNFNWLLSSF